MPASSASSPRRAAVRGDSSLIFSTAVLPKARQGATWKVAPCLAFGNTAVLKMSELSPLTAARLGELALEAGIPAGVLNVVHGYGKEVGEPLCAHQDVRAISFTGSTV